MNRIDISAPWLFLGTRHCVGSAGRIQEFSLRMQSTVCEVPETDRDKVLLKYPNRAILVIWKAGSLEEDPKEEICQSDV